jgi:hypothetical protein
MLSAVRGRCGISTWGPMWTMFDRIVDGQRANVDVC